MGNIRKSAPQLLIKIRPKTCQCNNTYWPALCACSPPQLQLKTRPKTCQCPKNPSYYPFLRFFSPTAVTIGQKHVNAPKNPSYYPFLQFFSHKAATKDQAKYMSMHQRTLLTTLSFGFSPPQP